MGPLGVEHELVHWNAHYICIGTILQAFPVWLWSSLRQSATELKAARGSGARRRDKKGGGLLRLPLIRGTCRQSAPPSSLPSVQPRTPLIADAVFLAAVIIAIASLDFHFNAGSCAVCLLMRSSSYDPEVLFIYLIIYSTQHV